jgi:two-component system, OmpR family, phosphate regulon sensor histidine kinase PhoR
MSKKLLWSLAAFMGIVMIGLIFVQTYWIKTAIMIKENQFNQIVSRSLSNISYKLEEQEAAKMLYDYIIPEVETKTDATGNMFSFNLRFGSASRVQSYVESAYIELQQELANQSDLQGAPVKFPNVRSANDSSIIQLPGRNYDDTSIIGESLPRINLLNTKDLEEKINQKKKQIDRIMSKMLMSENDIENRIQKETLERNIKAEMRNRGINLDFEYAVVKQNMDVAIKSDHYNPAANSKIYTTQLFPQDIFHSPNYLRIYFPGQKSFIFKSIGLIGLTSVSLTMIIIAVFIFTLWIIFRQKRLSEIRNDFVNNMTHELKTPISTISLASQMLSDESIPNVNKNLPHISGIINTESKRLGIQVEKVLQMAVFDRGKIKLKLKTLDANEVLDAALNNFELLIRKRGGVLESDLKAKQTKVNVDEVHFTNMISNLLDNAVKYCKEVPDIKLSTRNEKNYLVIAIADKGIGISNDDQKRVFEKFYRVPTGNVHNVKGFGLGLSYVKKIVEVHQGYLKLKSEINKGSVFELFIPLYT